jgi:hypothetical protein
MSQRAASAFVTRFAIKKKDEDPEPSTEVLISLNPPNTSNIHLSTPASCYPQLLPPTSSPIPPNPNFVLISFSSQSSPSQPPRPILVDSFYHQEGEPARLQNKRKTQKVGFQKAKMPNDFLEWRRDFHEKKRRQTEGQVLLSFISLSFPFFFSWFAWFLMALVVSCFLCFSVFFAFTVFFFSLSLPFPSTLLFLSDSLFREHRSSGGKNSPQSRPTKPEI